MSSQRLPKNALRDSARVVASELIRPTVKEAVRDVLREEGISPASPQVESTGQSSQSDQGGGRSRFALVAVLLAVAGVAFLARRRMQSTSGSWSGPGTEEEGGYATEGQVQTAEGTGESENVEH